MRVILQNMSGLECKGWVEMSLKSFRVEQNTHFCLTVFLYNCIIKKRWQCEEGCVASAGNSGAFCSSVSSWLSPGWAGSWESCPRSGVPHRDRGGPGSFRSEQYSHSRSKPYAGFVKHLHNQLNELEGSKDHHLHAFLPLYFLIFCYALSFYFVQ